MPLMEIEEHSLQVSLNHCHNAASPGTFLGTQGGWSMSEDMTLRISVEELGPKIWLAFAQQMKAKTPDECRKRDQLHSYLIKGSFERKVLKSAERRRMCDTKQEPLGEGGRQGEHAH